MRGHSPLAEKRSGASSHVHRHVPLIVGSCVGSLLCHFACQSRGPRSHLLGLICFYSAGSVRPRVEEPFDEAQNISDSCPTSSSDRTPSPWTRAAASGQTRQPPRFRNQVPFAAWHFASSWAPAQKSELLRQVSPVSLQKMPVKSALSLPTGLKRVWDKALVTFFAETEQTK